MRSPLDPAFVLPWYAFPELDGMEPRARARLVEDAAERVTTQTPMLVTWGVTLAVLAAVAVAFLPALRAAPFLLLLAGALAAFVPLLAVRRVLVRRTVAALRAQQGG